jgi:phosphoribosyl-ATP pyrophosphohydrolase/phosphoribosyl-AMP cyclohydrolase
MFDNLKFDENGLIPAIVQDKWSKEVLTLAYMNRESLEISIQEGRTCFFSRSRKTLWRKGETSGNVQRIASIRADCDGDALVVEVDRDGPACHSGSDSCFFNSVHEAEPPFSLDSLFKLIDGRKRVPQPGSYTSYLFDKGADKILKKVGEECAEVLIAAKGGDRTETVFEISDLTYHLMVLIVEMGITPKDILSQLASRHVVDKKVKQEKMQ